ncbi:MAG TPA: PAS domain-containing protein [Candidatus Kapabacteria bacterium]|nr:PAS domain-containing protein [Candidatus Kapabacteria bacterium]
MRQSIIRKSAYAGFIAALLILGIIAYISFQETKNFLATTGDLSHTHEALEDIDTINILIKDIQDETLQYIITKDAQYFAQRDSTVATLGKIIKDLRDSVSQNPAQLQNLDKLESIFYRIPSYPTPEQLPAFNAGDISQNITSFLRVGRPLMDSLRIICDAMDHAQEKLFLERQQSISEGSIQVRNALQYGTAVIVALLFIMVYFLQRDITHGKRTTKILADLNSDLEDRVQKRTAELQKEINEHQRAEEKLKEQQAFNEMLLQAENDVGIGIAITLDTQIIYANNALCQILGLTAEEVKSLPSLFVLVIAEERERLMKILQQSAFASENFSSTDETIIQRRNGERIHIEYSTKGVRIGGQTYMFSAVRNITERKQEEDRLRRSEASLAEAQRLAHIGSWEMNLSLPENIDKNKVIWSDEVYRIFGYHPGEIELTREFFRQTVHPGDRERLDSAARKYLNDNHQHSIDYRIIRPDGTERIIHEEGKTLRDETTGKPFRIVGTAQDITERVKMEKQLRDYNEQVKNIMENVDVALMTADMVNSLPLMLSPAWEKIYGYPLEKFYADDMLWKKVIHPDDLPMVEASEKMLWVGKPAIDEYRIIRAEGAIRWVEGRIKPTLNENGQLVRIDGFITDITERKEAEKKIYESLKEKEILLKEVHHRVKNNMQIISSMLNLQEEFMHDPHDRDAFRDTQNRIKSMALVHEMLYQSEDLAKIDFDLYIRTIVQQLLESYTTEPDKIDLEVQTNNIHLDVNAAIPCGLIINELVSNSLKYAFPGNRKGKISIVFAKDERGGYCCTVSDNGIGLPNEVDLGHSSTLGLQLVDTLVHQLGGNIDISRESGTTFRINFSGAKKVT